MSRYFSLFAFILLAACDSKETGKSASSQESNIEAAGDTLFSGDFYKRYNGTVAGKPVVVQLQFAGGRLEGSYQYASQGEAIELSDFSDTTNDEVHELTEIAPGHQSDWPTWTLNILRTEATGEWRDPLTGQRSTIQLKEAYPQGSTRLQVFSVVDSMSLFADKPNGPKAVTSYVYLQPTGSGMLNELLIRQFLPDHVAGEEVQVSIRSANQAYFNQYRADNASLGASSGGAGFTLNYEEGSTQRVLFNDQDWLVVELYISSYTGGAHGNYESKFLNIDRTQNRVWSLSDIVADSSALQSLLNEAAIYYFKIPQGAHMTDRLLVGEVPVTNNFYLSATGLCFSYDPYEIAAYSDGQIKLFIPYSRLMPLLTPAFRERMHLAERNSGPQRI